MPDSYGPDWPPPCIDLWVEFSPADGSCVLDGEGFRVGRWLGDHPEVAADIAAWPHDPDTAARGIAVALATVMGLDLPEEETS
jgi:hypothetical protein